MASDQLGGEVAQGRPDASPYAPGLIDQMDWWLLPAAQPIPMRLIGDVCATLSGTGRHYARRSTSWQIVKIWHFTKLTRSREKREGGHLQLRGFA